MLNSPVNIDTLHYSIVGMRKRKRIATKPKEFEVPFVVPSK